MWISVSHINCDGCDTMEVLLGILTMIDKERPMHMRLGIETVGAISRLILFSAIIASCGQANKADVASNSHDLEQAIANGNYDSDKATNFL